MLGLPQSHATPFHKDRPLSVASAPSTWVDTASCPQVPSSRVIHHGILCRTARIFSTHRFPQMWSLVIAIRLIFGGGVEGDQYRLPTLQHTLTLHFPGRSGKIFGSWSTACGIGLATRNPVLAMTSVRGCPAYSRDPVCPSRCPPRSHSGYRGSSDSDGPDVIKKEQCFREPFRRNKYV